MKWSIKLGKRLGIDVYLHFTFLLRRCATVPVFADSRMVGLLTLENIGEMIMVNAAMNTNGAARP